jgi:hypothetical protein
VLSLEIIDGSGAVRPENAWSIVDLETPCSIADLRTWSKKSSNEPEFAKTLVVRKTRQKNLKNICEL